MWLLRTPFIVLLASFGFLLGIDFFVVPLHHVKANKEGIFALECIAMGLLFGSAAVDKVQSIRGSVQSPATTGTPHGHHELFTWSEIGKVLVSLCASLVIFLAVAYVIENHLKQETIDPTHLERTEH